MKEELRIHSFIHFNGEILTCFYPDCNQIFKKQKLLNNHIRKHEMPIFQCNICEQMFKYRSNLGKHLRKGRCKGVAEAEVSQNNPEEDAEIAKKQLIAMTVNLTRFNVFQKEHVEDKPAIKKEKKKKEAVNISYQQDEVHIKQEVDSSETISFLNVLEEIKTELETSSVTIEKRTRRKISKRKASKIIRHPTGMYQCDYCDVEVKRKSEILSHIRHHIALVKHKCKKCPETFSTRMKLHNHSMKSHGQGVIGSVEYSDEVSECLTCHQLFSGERMKVHVKLHEAPLHNCKVCQKIFRSQAALDKHFLNQHTGSKIFICATCGKGFKKQTILRQHEEVHNPYKIYVVCEICNQMMLGRSIKLHMEVKHGDRYKEKNHICECGKAFRYENQLEKHREAVHEKVTRGIEYPCPDCEQTFSRRSGLREHSFEHFNGKVFYCDVLECGMKFKKRKLLTIHSVVHKEVQWPCDACSLTFQTRGGRKKHQIKMHGQVVVEEILEIPSCA